MLHSAQNSFTSFSGLSFLPFFSLLLSVCCSVLIADGLFCFPASLFVLSSLPLATSSSRNNINANGSPLKPCTDGSCDPDSEESPIGHERRSQPGTGQSQDAHRPACDTDALMQAEEVTETKAEANRAPALVNGDGEAPGISQGQQWNSSSPRQRNPRPHSPAPLLPLSKASSP